jgi:hypothetical protein
MMDVNKNYKVLEINKQKSSEGEQIQDEVEDSYDDDDQIEDFYDDDVVPGAKEKTRNNQDLESDLDYS